MIYIVVYTIINAPKYSGEQVTTTVNLGENSFGDIPTIIALSRGVKAENVRIESLIRMPSYDEILGSVEKGNTKI